MEKKGGELGKKGGGSIVRGETKKHESRQDESSNL